MKIRILLALLAAFSLAHAQNSSDAAFNQLAKVDRFAFGGVGYAGETSRGERDYKLILSRTSAETDFERLLALANLQAKAYALVGIRKLHPDRFKELAIPFRNSTEVVVTETGCSVNHEPFGLVLKRIGAGDYFRKR